MSNNTNNKKHKKLNLLTKLYLALYNIVSSAWYCVNKILFKKFLNNGIVNQENFLN